MKDWILIILFSAVILLEIAFGLGNIYYAYLSAFGMGITILNSVIGIGCFICAFNHAKILIEYIELCSK